MNSNPMKNRRKSPVRAALNIMQVLALILAQVGGAFLGVQSAQAEGTVRDTRTWTSPDGSISITFSTLETYASCSSPGDRIYTTGVPANWSLTGYVKVVVVKPDATWSEVGYYPINQYGNLDLTLPYPPAWTWPYIPPPPNVRELHVDLGITVRDQDGNVVPWIGVDPNIPGLLGPHQDWDVYCQNPSPAPQINIVKYTNGADANNPDGADVPNIAVGAPVTWTYLISNPSNWPIHKSYITVTDNQPGVVPVFDHVVSGNADNILNPGEVWAYMATGPALDLSAPPAGVFVQQNACSHDGNEPPRTAYVNVGTVSIEGYSASDPSSYCNPPAPTLFTLGDRVWYDQNRNGIQDANEPGYNGATVDLYANAACTGMPMASTDTGLVGPAGFYQFTGLPAGDYCVQFGNIPAGWSISPPDQGDGTNDSSANPSAQIPNIHLTANDPHEDMGIFVPGSLGDSVTCLTTGDPLAYITVSLFKDFNGDGVADGPAIATTETNTSGFYQFTGLEVTLAGDPNNLTKYLVVVDVNDADLGACNVPVPPTSYNPPLDSDHPNDPNNDFWFKLPPAVYTLGDRVWYDQNRNGIQDANEPGYNGATVDLYANAACTGMPMASTVTGLVGPAGFYQFTGLPAGDYCVQFGNIPAGWSISPPDQGDGTNDSSANPSAQIPNIHLTANDPDEDMGIFVPGSLGDSVTCLTTGDPLAYITVSLFKDFNGDGVADGPAITTETNTSGFYQFTGLEVALAGDPNNLTKYLVVVDVNDADLGACNVPVPPTSYNPPLDSDHPNDPNNDFWFEKPACQLTLGNRVWLDANLDGIQDANELGLDGVVLNLLDANGNPVLDGSSNPITATTANGGYYQFVVPCGAYQIAVVLPDGKTLTLVEVGNNRSVDSNPSPSPAPTIPLPNGGEDLSIDFGLVNFQDLCPPDGTTGLPEPVGTLYWGIDANGDVYVRYDQSRGLNDNSYGVNRVLWPRDHKFGDLVGSDKAQLIFKDATGKVVLDINLDYISAKSGTPSGYASLGVSGGEGKVNIGAAAWVLAADTSLAKNLNNTGFCVGGNCSLAGTNLLVDSPPTVSSSSYALPAGSPYIGWNFTNSYEVKISKLAFGASTFGSVAVGEVHNSPPKVGTNAIIPAICEPVGVCSVTAGVATVKDRTFKWPLTNNGSTAAVLTELSLIWPQGNGQLRKVKLDADVVWDGRINWTADGVTLTSADFTTDLKKKRIDPGKKRVFTLEFEKNAITDLAAYTLSVTFDNSCTIEYTPPTFADNFCATAPGSGRAKTLTMVYTDANGGDSSSFNCTSNCNTQDPSKVIVTGDPAPDTQVWILATPTGKTNVLFQGLVNLFQAFIMSAPDAGLSTFDTNTTVKIFSDSTMSSLLSTVQFHTSCSQPLNDGDYYGSLMLTGFTR